MMGVPAALRKLVRRSLLLMVVLCTLVPVTAHAQALYAVGNRVWADTDNSGTINGSEAGIDGVTVDLYRASTLTFVSTQVTLNGGYYLFNELEAGDYVIAIAASNFAGGGVLAGYWSSGTARAANGTIAEPTATAANTDIDSDDNGTLESAGLLAGAVVSSTVTLGPAGSEPRDEWDMDSGRQGQPDDYANMTVDFGFYSIRLGDLVWHDLDNDGHLNSPEVGIDGVTLELLSGDGTASLTTTTTAGGGIYEFPGLPAGDYRVRLPAVNFNPGGTLLNYRSSTGLLPALGYEPAPDPNTDTTDSDDNGSEVNGPLGLGGYIESAPVTLTPGDEQSVTAAGVTVEDRVDFGVNNSPQIDLRVTKTDGVTSGAPGGTLHYVVVVTNNGPADANGVTLNDARPAQIDSWTWTCRAGTPPSYNCTDDATNPATFTDTLDLPQLGSLTYDVTAQVALDAVGDIENRVYVVPPPGMTDLTNADNIAVDTDTLATTTLTVTKTASPDPAVSPRAPLTYSIAVTNSGAVAAGTVTLTDTLPAGVVYRDAAGTGWNCQQAAGIVTCTMALLAPGAAPPITISTQAPGMAGSVTNTATASAVNASEASSSVRTDVVMPIPMLDGRALAALMLLFLGAGAWAARRVG